MDRALLPSLTRLYASHRGLCWCVRRWAAGRTAQASPANAQGQFPQQQQQQAPPQVGGSSFREVSPRESENPRQIRPTGRGRCSFISCLCTEPNIRTTAMSCTSCGFLGDCIQKNSPCTSAISILSTLPTAPKSQMLWCMCLLFSAWKCGVLSCLRLCHRHLLHLRRSSSVHTSRRINPKVVGALTLGKSPRGWFLSLKACPRTRWKGGSLDWL